MKTYLVSKAVLRLHVSFCGILVFVFLVYILSPFMYERKKPISVVERLNCLTPSVELRVRAMVWIA